MSKNLVFDEESMDDRSEADDRASVQADQDKVPERTGEIEDAEEQMEQSPGIVESAISPEDLDSELLSLKKSSTDSEASLSRESSGNSRAKAYQRLGVSPAVYIVMNRLGLTQEEAETALKSSSTSPPGLDSPRQLSADPRNRAKLKKVLGIEEDDELRSAIEAALAGAFEPPEDGHRSGGNTPMRKGEHSKAYNVLGEDPSHERLMKKLGLSDREVKKALEEERRARSDRETERLKSSGDVRHLSVSKNKRETSKALKVMGEDPITRNVIKKKLGITDDKTLDKALEEGRQEARMSQIRQAEEESQKSNTMINRVEQEKALKRLGYDPSEAKLMQKLGISAQELQDAIQISTK